jgi:hypothetical protein
MQNTEQSNHDGGLPSGSFTTEVFCGNIGFSISKEDEEKNETVDWSVDNRNGV